MKNSRIKVNFVEKIKKFDTKMFVLLPKSIFLAIKDSKN
jgi:hypothetical protein